MLGHAVADLAQVAADVGEAGAGAQEVRRQRMPGLVRDGGSECQSGHPELVVVREKLQVLFISQGAGDLVAEGAA
ncbi:hypothetical protein [Amycolatopsis balhimycina]|uniref:hypothetical protein n=1 Tax=Amycolatopsis balhimycina TaxID=208443 RepID=UPI001FE041EE|nr:hypothetical protein [Amycolatopsis balhimycina]